MTTYKQLKEFATPISSKPSQTLLPSTAISLLQPHEKKLIPQSQFPSKGITANGATRLALLATIALSMLLTRLLEFLVLTALQGLSTTLGVVAVVLIVSSLVELEGF